MKGLVFLKKRRKIILHNDLLLWLKRKFNICSRKQNLWFEREKGDHISVRIRVQNENHQFNSKNARFPNFSKHSYFILSLNASLMRKSLKKSQLSNWIHRKLCSDACKTKLTTHLEMNCPRSKWPWEGSKNSLRAFLSKVISGNTVEIEYRIFSIKSRAYFKLTRFLVALIFESCLFPSYVYF